MDIKKIEQKWEIRDLRKKDMYKLDDAYLNGYAKICGIYATVVYNSLCRHANFYNQECFPSLKKIAEEHNISKPKVVDAINILKSANIIQVVSERTKDGKQKNNIYIMVDKSNWFLKDKLIPVKNNRGKKNIRDNNGKFTSRVHKINPDSRVNDTVEPSQSYGDSRVNVMDSKDNKVLRITNTKDNKVSNSKELPIYLDKFKSINVFYKKFFANTTERKAMNTLLEEVNRKLLDFVMDNMEEMLKDKYCPRFSKPTVLLRKWADISIYIAQKVNPVKKSMGVISAIK